MPSQDEWPTSQTELLPTPQAVHDGLSRGKIRRSSQSLKSLPIREVDLDSVGIPSDFALARIIQATKLVLDRAADGQLSSVSDDNNVELVRNRWWRRRATARRLAIRSELLPLLRYDIYTDYSQVIRGYALCLHLPARFVEQMYELLQMNGYNPDIGLATDTLYVSL